MATLPRILAIMGSGETSPTMTSVHADLLALLGPPPVPAVLLDTPFGFQENAPDICTKTITYFRENVRHPIGVASFRRADSAGRLAYETMLAQVREARYVFAGPGSPSYALRQWHGSGVADALTEKLREGGCVVFASAAACTLGCVALPVYEVYKVGQDPEWLQGLDVLAAIGINAALIPHFNNAEGGTHDTRYCYMGERRLRILEEVLPAGAYILGVDEHTACIVDIGAGTVSVRGNGGVSLRRRGRMRRLESGTTVDLEVLRRGEVGDADGAAAQTSGEQAPMQAPESATSAGALAGNPFMDGVAAHRRDFDAALEAADIEAALGALLALDAHLWSWSRDTLDSDAMDRARSQMRTMLVRLGAIAQAGARDPREVVGPYVEAILELRGRARAERRFADADALRDALLHLGVEVHDRREGSSGWQLPNGGPAGASAEASSGRAAIRPAPAPPPPASGEAG